MPRTGDSGARRSAVAFQDIQARVRRVVERTLAEQQYARQIDVLLGLGWFGAPHLDRWRTGRRDGASQRLGAADLLEDGIVDRIVPELPGAAEEPVEFCRRLGAVLR